MTFYTVFTIELYSRRVQILGSTPHPDEAFMLQIVRQLTAAGDGLCDGERMFLCDRDRKWSRAVRQLLEVSGVRVIQTPFRAPNCNAHAERFVRSIKEECLDRLIPLASGTFVTRWPSTSSTTIGNAITRASGMISSIVLAISLASNGSGAGSASVVFSATTIAPRSFP